MTTAPRPQSPEAMFPVSTDEAWRGLVAKVLKGQDFERRLVSVTADGIKIAPLYRRADRGEGDLGVANVVAPGGGGAWDVQSLVFETDAHAANAVILDELAGGATSIRLMLAETGGVGLPVDAIPEALTGVALDSVGVVFDGGGAEVAKKLTSLWTARGVGLSSVYGGIGFDPIGAYARQGVSRDGIAHDVAEAGRLVADMQGAPYVSALVARGAIYHDAGASEAQELAAVLATVVAYLRAAESHGVAPAQALPKIEVRLAVDADQMLGIAKLRAARRLMAEVASACGAADAAAQVVLSAEASMRMLSARDPWVNILRVTMAVATAAMGGAQTVTALPHTWPMGRPDAFARRIARNIHHVLNEESGLGRVADPAAGSFAIEALTADLVRKAWAAFQRIEAGGGIVLTLAAGWLQTEIADVRTRRTADVATGKFEVTGTSAFAKLGADGVTVTPWPTMTAPQQATSISPLRPYRYSEPFERLRDRADAAKTQGVKPQVFLATLGDLALHVSRATWTRNFLAAGGIATVEAGALLASPDVGRAFAESGTTVAVVVGDDATYEMLGEAVAGVLKAAGAERVWFAGRPKALEAALKAAGADAFIYAGCDMIETLTALHGDLGLMS